MTNDNDYVLCRTLFLKNGMGGANYNMEYGLCILTKNKIIEYTIFTFNIDTKDSYKLIDKWDNWLNNDSTPNIRLKEEVELIKKYSFNNTDLTSYIKNDTIAIDSFNKKNKIDICTSIKAHSLRNGKPECDYGIGKDIVISYNFRYAIITKNYVDDNENLVGISYNYKNPFLPLFFEMQDIDGIIFK